MTNSDGTAIPSQPARGRWAPPGLEESRHLYCKLPMGDTTGKEPQESSKAEGGPSQRLARKEGCQSCNLKEMNLANKQWSWKTTLSLSCHWISAWDDLEQDPASLCWTPDPQELGDNKLVLFEVQAPSNRKLMQWPCWWHYQYMCCWSSFSYFYSLQKECLSITLTPKEHREG